jgi:CubicO group peptidase (beta-lactamase class C family)
VAENLKKLTFVLSVLLFVESTFAKDLSVVKPEEVGMSSPRLERLDKVMDDYVRQGKLPGAVTLIARRGKIVHYKAYGMMDIEAKKPMQEDTMFRIASMSKAITSVAVMILYEEGHFLLTDPISKYIPEFKNPQVIEINPETKARTLVPARREITIRNLLNHTSGITYGDGPQAEYYKQAGMTVGLTPTEGTIGQMIRKLGKLPLISHPGEEFHYGMSVDVLGYLVEVISGQTFDEFLKQRIFVPLQMNDTYMILPEDKLPRLAKTYRYIDGKMVESDIDLSYLIKQTYFSGGAGLVSTPADYFRFAQMLLNKGKLDGVRILSRKTVEMMTLNSIGDLYIWQPFEHNGIMGDKFGLGFGIRTERGKYDQLESLGIFGWDGAFYTRFWVDPKEELVGIFMSQVDNYWQETLIGKFRVLTYQAIAD